MQHKYGTTSLWNQYRGVNSGERHTGRQTENRKVITEGPKILSNHIGYFTLRL